MSRIPPASGKQVVRALQKVGFEVLRQHGSHIIVRRADPYAQTVVPNHASIHRGTLRSIINQAGLTVEEFVALL